MLVETLRGNRLLLEINNDATELQSNRPAARSRAVAEKRILQRAFRAWMREMLAS
jgi:hypothetical protein